MGVANYAHAPPPLKELTLEPLIHVYTCMCMYNSHVHVCTCIYLYMYKHHVLFKKLCFLYLNDKINGTYIRVHVHVHVRIFNLIPFPYLFPVGYGCHCSPLS